MSATLDRTATFSLDAAERARLTADGFVLRERVFSGDECAAILRDCETLLREVEAAKHGDKVTVGSYMFEMLSDAGVLIKWEPDAPNVIQGIEPFAHISGPLRDWGLDPRLIEPCKALVGDDDLVFYTEKLNVKRAHHGGPIVLHQDYPYWEKRSPVAHRIATAMVFLDHASRENGCLEVAPGSHTAGKHKQRDVEGFGALEMDSSAFDTGKLVALEVPPGSVVFFGPFLVHRSLPNRSGRDRRALLYSYQPRGFPHALEIHRRLKQGESAAPKR
jgi:Phytanoyl-CoA dioxygenase (PhyH)